MKYITIAEARNVYLLYSYQTMSLLTLTLNVFFAKKIVFNFFYFEK
jgi:hypothetical protein